MSGFSTARQNMVDGQVRPSDVTDLRIINAMLAVPREAFVPEGQRALAYLDLDLDVSEGASEKGFLIKPVVTAKMLQAAEIKDTDNVLVAGCATGYTAALVARLAGRGTGTRGDPVLGAKANDVLTQFEVPNVTVGVAPAAEGYPANALYDVIVLNGATEVTPDRLYRQLKERGRVGGAFSLPQPPRGTVGARSH